MKKIVLNYGLLAGAILAVVICISTPLWKSGALQGSAGEWVGYSSMIVALSAVFFGVRAYRDKEAGGVISFGKAFKVGLLISLVAAAIYVGVWIIYMNFIDRGEFMNEYIQHHIEQLRQSGQPAAEVEKQVAQMLQFKEMYKNPLVQIGMTFMEIFPVGLLISLFSAALLRKKSNSDIPAMQVQ